ncbi:hypothetical protein KSC_001740 [Ktedonobacter sp. SOSP1-52]|uniref:hypothetical protein n=1 Tax=Ktedonobacter sp. SOSP1-52 TaxID=2778366 RepID=UPI00191621C0|nr:hypothetical protein [Ktedonobacter sp. SOSP1-52]GHO61282.1 hypothetical protein KSC_001740 [Ktedonobacter sp. SOSP1-52]
MSQSPLLAPEGQILALVKPLFEVESADARRSGRIDDVALLVEALQQVVEAGRTCGLSIQGIAKLALTPAMVFTNSLLHLFAVLVLLIGSMIHTHCLILFKDQVLVRLKNGANPCCQTDEEVNS